MRERGIGRMRIFHKAEDYVAFSRRIERGRESLLLTGLGATMSSVLKHATAFTTRQRRIRVPRAQSGGGSGACFQKDEGPRAFVEVRSSKPRPGCRWRCGPRHAEGIAAAHNSYPLPNFSSLRISRKDY